MNWCGAKRGDGRPVHVGPALHMRTSTLLLLSLLVSAAVAFSTNAAPAKKLKILCLHGYSQCGGALFIALVFYSRVALTSLLPRSQPASAIDLEDFENHSRNQNTR